MPQELYFNVPSMIPLTKAQAYEIAKDRWSVHVAQVRDTPGANVGITWQGIQGSTHYAKWDELPATTRQYL